MQRNRELECLMLDYYGDLLSVDVNTENTHRQADPFDVSASQNLSFRHLKQLEFQ